MSRARVEISSPLACHVVFYYSSGWESRGFFPHGKSSRLTTGDSLGTLTTGKRRRALAIEISSSPACHVVFYYSSGWESRGFFPYGKSSRLTTGDLLGTLITEKPNQGAGRFGGLLGVSATPTTRRVLVIWAGALRVMHCAHLSAD